MTGIPSFRQGFPSTGFDIELEVNTSTKSQAKDQGKISNVNVNLFLDH